MKKVGLVLIIALLMMAIAGCTLPFNPVKTSPTAAAHPSDTTPGVIVTQQSPVTATPTSSYWLSGYKEINVNREQYLPGRTKITYDKLYHTDDWNMPFPLGGPGVRAASHGAVLKVKFYNPSSSTWAVLLDNDVKATFSYFDANGVRHPLVTADVFYDEATDKTFMETTVAPGQTKSMWILAYISSDADYEKYGGRLDTPTLDANPGYAPM